MANPRKVNAMTTNNDTLGITVASLSVMTDRSHGGGTFPYQAVLDAALSVIGTDAIIISGSDQTGWPTSTANGYVRGLQERHGPAFLKANNLGEYIVKAGVTGNGMATGRKAVKVAIVKASN